MSEYGYLRLGPNRYRERFGLDFEDLAVGLCIRHRPGIDVSQQDNREEAVDLVNNAQLHYDSRYAARTEWENPLGVSTLTLQRLFGMVSKSWYRRRNLLGIDEIAMTHPVFGGDTLYAASTVTGLEAGEDPDVGRVGLAIEGTNQRGERVARIACRIELYRRGRHPEDEPLIEPAEEERFRLYHTAADGALVERRGIDRLDERVMQRSHRVHRRVVLTHRGLLQRLERCDLGGRETQGRAVREKRPRR